MNKFDGNRDGSLDRDELKATRWLESVITKADINRDGSVSSEEAVRRWSRMRRDELAATQSFQSAVFSPDGSSIVSVTRNEHIQIWETESGKLLHTTVGTDPGVSALALSKDGRLLATCGGEKVIKLWRIER